MKATIATYTGQVHVIDGVDSVKLDKQDYYISVEFYDKQGRLVFALPLSNVSTVQYQYD